MPDRAAAAVATTGQVAHRQAKVNGSSTCSAAVEKPPHLPLEVPDRRRAAPPPDLVALVTTQHGARWA